MDGGEIDLPSDSMHEPSSRYDMILVLVIETECIKRINEAAAAVDARA